MAKASKAVPVAKVAADTTTEGGEAIVPVLSEAQVNQAISGYRNVAEARNAVTEAQQGYDNAEGWKGMALAFAKPFLALLAANKGKSKSEREKAVKQFKSSRNAQCLRALGITDSKQGQPFRSNAAKVDAVFLAGAATATFTAAWAAGKYSAEVNVNRARIAMKAAQPAKRFTVAKATEGFLKRIMREAGVTKDDIQGQQRTIDAMVAFLNGQRPTLASVAAEA